MASILFYTVTAGRPLDQESLMKTFASQGHSVVFVNRCVNDRFQKILESYGVRCYHKVPSPNLHPRIQWFIHVVFLLRIIYRHKVRVVYSHFEPPNFVAIWAQYFCRARVIIVRHHVELARMMGFENDWSYQFTYQKARDVIAVSDVARRFMIEQEGVEPGKIHKIDLGYDFSLYSFDPQVVAAIRQKFKADVLMLTVGYLSVYKRPELALEVLKQLVSKGVDARLIYLGSGELKAKLQQKATRDGIGDRTHFEGYVDNVLNYMHASNFLVHLSATESSCVSIKEAGLASLPVIVCDGVGDFNEYLRHDENAFVVPFANPVSPCVELIASHWNNQAIKSQLGAALEKTIRERFDVSKVIHHYDEFNS